MDEETKETLIKVAAYAGEEKQAQHLRMRQIIGGILIGFGVFLAISALAIFPRDSSWGAIYSVIGALILSAGVCQLLYRRNLRFLSSAGCFLLLFALLLLTDYLGVTLGNQLPRFAYAKEWGEEGVTFKAPFCQVVWHHPDTENEYIEVIR